MFRIREKILWGFGMSDKEKWGLNDQTVSSEILLNNLFTIFYYFKNGGSYIAQIRASNSEQLQDKIIEELSSDSEINIIEAEKKILISYYMRFRADFKMVPIESCLNNWALDLTIPVNIYIVKTSVIVQKS